MSNPSPARVPQNVDPGRLRPDPSIERMCPGKSGPAAHVERQLS